MSARFDNTAPGRFRVVGALSFATAADLLRQSEPQFGQKARAEIDLAEVSDSDSAGLALLIEWKRLARASGGTVEFANIPPQLSALARISEVDELIGPADSQRTPNTAAAS